MSDDTEIGGPLLSPGSAAPGRWNPGGPGSVWEGTLSWRTQNGPAITFWSTGTPYQVQNALLVDGTRGTVEAPRPGAWTSRMKNAGADGYTHGILIWRHDDVEFIPLVRNPLPLVRSEEQPAFEALRRCAEFVDFVRRDVIHGFAAYHAIENRDCRLPDGTMFQFGQRRAGIIIAALRNNGEEYLDFFAADDPSFDESQEFRAEILEILERNSFRIQAD